MSNKRRRLTTHQLFRPRGMVAAAIAWGTTTVAAAQGPQLGLVMREKLQHAQGVLEAVVTSNWSALDAHSRELERLTNDRRWSVLKSPEYATHSAAFVRALRDLRRAADERDSGKATELYAAVVTRCVDCHRYVARARIAR